MSEEYLQANEVAEILGITRQKLYRLQKAKRIKFTLNTRNNYRMYKREDVEECARMIKEEKKNGKIKTKMFL